MIIPANTEQKNLFSFLTLQDEITESLTQSPWAAGHVSLGVRVEVGGGGGRKGGRDRGKKRQCIFSELEASGWPKLGVNGETLKTPGQLKNISLY